MQDNNIFEDKTTKVNDGGTKLVSELNESNELVTESNDTDKKLESFADIFTKRAGIMQMAKDGEALRNAFVGQLSQVTQVAVKTNIDEDLEKMIYGRYKEMGVTPHECSNEQLDVIFKGVDFVEGIEDKIGKKDMTFHGFLKEYLTLFTATEESIEMTDNAMSEIEKANDEYISEVNELISTLDTFEHMNNLLAKADVETDPLRKEAIMHEWKTMYAASDLDYILCKLSNKPRKVLLKEMKNYEEVKKKAFNILKNDKKSQFMDIRALEEVLISVYGKELTEQIRILLFLIYKKINRRNTVDDERLVVFINLFTLNAYKLRKYSESEKTQSVFYTKLKEALTTI